MVVIDAIAEDGTFNLSLTSLYDGPTYYFRSYVEQNGDYTFGKIGSFELLTEQLKRVKKITRHEQMPGVEFNWIYEFEYDSRGRITSSKVTEIEDGDSYGVHYTYDYSTNGVVSVNERFIDNGELEEEQTTYILNVDDRGRVTNYDYTWEDNWGDDTYEDIHIYHYSVTLDYSEEGFLNSWYESGDDGVYGIEYTYLDGRITEMFIDREGDYDSLIHLDESFTSDHKVKHTSFDINKAINPEFYPDGELIWFSNINIGTIGDYYFDRMYVESIFYYDSVDIPIDDYTYDANYKKTITVKDYYYEGMDDELETLPITTATYDKDGYPVEFIADIREYEGEMEATYAAGDILWEEEDGPIYEVVEVDRKIISKGPATSVGSATITIEYCE
jgi:hypothetical protein